MRGKWEKGSSASSDSTPTLSLCSIFTQDASFPRWFGWILSIIFGWNYYVFGSLSARSSPSSHTDFFVLRIFCVRLGSAAISKDDSRIHCIRKGSLLTLEHFVKNRNVFLSLHIILLSWQIPKNTSSGKKNHNFCRLMIALTNIRWCGYI